MLLYSGGITFWACQILIQLAFARMKMENTVRGTDPEKGNQGTLM